MELAHGHRAVLTSSPNIVICNYRPKRSKKRRPQPEPACGRIITIEPRKKVSTVPYGVPDDAQRRVLIQRYLAQQKDTPQDALEPH